MIKMQGKANIISLIWEIRLTNLNLRSSDTTGRYLECIGEYLSNNHPDHTPSSKASTERQKLVEGVGTYE